MEKPNVEALVISWLTGIVGDGWQVFGDKPKVAPEKYILIDRTGGPREAMVLDRAEILIEVYHKESRLEASNKANEIADRITELLSYSDQSITHADINSVVNLGDTLTQYQRYQVYCDIYCRR